MPAMSTACSDWPEWIGAVTCVAIPCAGLRECISIAVAHQGLVYTAAVFRRLFTATRVQLQDQQQLCRQKGWDARLPSSKECCQALLSQVQPGTEWSGGSAGKSPMSTLSALEYVSI